MACGLNLNPFEGFGLAGCAAEAVGNAVGGFLEDLGNAVVEAVGRAVASLGTMWVNIGTPVISGEPSQQAVSPGEHADVSGLTTTLSYVSWLGWAIAAISLIALGGRLAISMRRGEGMASLGKLGIVLAACILIGASGAIVSGIMAAGPTQAGGAAQFVQNSLWFYAGLAAVAGVIVGAIKTAWEVRLDPAKDTFKALLTLLVASGVGVVVVGLCVNNADSFSQWILDRSLSCNVLETSGLAPGGMGEWSKEKGFAAQADTGSCFGKNVTTMLGLGAASGPLGVILIILLGLIALLAALVQILMMVARGGILVLLVGVLPLAASFTNTEMGKTWFKKVVGWLIAFILYKPAAAIIYATSFQLVGTDVFKDDGSGLLSVVVGLMLMIISLLALPAMLRLVMPMTAAVAGGAAGGAIAAGAMMSLPTGAASVGRLSGGGGRAGAAGNSGRSGPKGQQGPTGATSPAASKPSGAGASRAGASGAGASGAGAGAGAAGAAGGVAGVAVSAATQVGKAGVQGTKNLASGATGEES